MQCGVCDQGSCILGDVLETGAANCSTGSDAGNVLQTALRAAAAPCLMVCLALQ